MVDRYSSYRGDHCETESPSQYFYYSHHSNNPSFSSTLLDSIYRSIDQGKDQQQDMMIYREKMGRKQSFCNSDANVRGTAMVEKWMEKKAGETAVGLRTSAADLQTKKPRKHREPSSSSSSSESSGGGGTGIFSSSEAENFPVPRPKPVRTGAPGGGGVVEQKPKHEGGFLKTKSRALKIYGDLKKVKQPISPGGKLAGFLNSLFAGGNLKKTKTAANCGYESPSLKSGNTSTCSSASSFSRSCLSKTPSSRGNSSYGGAKRSVRFSPVSVIVDENCQPCGNKSLTEEAKITEKKRQNSSFELQRNSNEVRNAINAELAGHAMEKNRRVEEIARDLLRNYQKKNQELDQFSFDDLREVRVKNHVFDQDFDDEEEEDDAVSCASSDLFELDNLSAIGMERYREELPVYETTYLDTNRAIANGLIL